MALARSDRSQGGRPSMDAVMMFKVLVLQALYGLADWRTAFQIRARLSFMRFLGLDLHGQAPDVHDLAFPRAAREGRRGEAAVQAVRRTPSRRRLPGHGRADDRRLDRRGPAAAEHRRGEGRPDGRQCPRGVPSRRPWRQTGRSSARRTEMGASRRLRTFACRPVAGR